MFPAFQRNLRAFVGIRNFGKGSFSNHCKRKMNFWQTKLKAVV